MAANLQKSSYLSDKPANYIAPTPQPTSAWFPEGEFMGQPVSGTMQGILGFMAEMGLTGGTAAAPLAKPAFQKLAKSGPGLLGRLLNMTPQELRWIGQDFIPGLNKMYTKGHNFTPHAKRLIDNTIKRIKDYRGGKVGWENFKNTFDKATRSELGITTMKQLDDYIDNALTPFRNTGNMRFSSTAANRGIKGSYSPWTADPHDFTGSIPMPGQSKGFFKHLTETTSPYSKEFLDSEPGHTIEIMNRIGGTVSSQQMVKNYFGKKGTTSGKNYIPRGKFQSFMDKFNFGAGGINPMSIQSTTGHEMIHALDSPMKDYLAKGYFNPKTAAGKKFLSFTDEFGDPNMLFPDEVLGSYHTSGGLQRLFDANLLSPGYANLAKRIGYRNLPPFSNQDMSFMGPSFGKTIENQRYFSSPLEVLARKYQLLNNPSSQGRSDILRNLQKHAGYDAKKLTSDAFTKLW